MIDRQVAFSGIRDVASTLAFDSARLETYLSDRLPDFSGPLTVRQFRGGQSNPTYLLTTPPRCYVLRRKPPGRLLPSAHAVEREFRVTQALHTHGFPVAAPILLCEDPSVIGTTFYLMEHVDGRVIWEPHMPASTPAERAAVYAAMNAILAQLHSFDPQAIGLSDFGRGEDYVARQIARWSKQYRASQTDEIDEMERLVAWLPAHVPPAGPVRLVHGDYRLDNIVLAPEGPQEHDPEKCTSVLGQDHARTKETEWDDDPKKNPPVLVRAVLDWELSTLGDPLADFTYHLMAWHMPRNESGTATGTLVGYDLEALGIPSLADYVEDYAVRTGLDPRPHLPAYLAYNFFRIAAILQGIAGRVRDGTAANENAGEMERMVRPLAETAWSFAREAGAR